MKPHTYPVTTAYVYHKTATRWRYHRIRIPSPPHTHAIKPQPVGVTTVTRWRFNRHGKRFHRNPRAFSPYQGSVFTAPRLRFHRTKVTFSPYTYTVERLAQNERPDRGKRPRQRSNLGTPRLRPRRGRHLGKAGRFISARLRRCRTEVQPRCGCRDSFDPPLPHTSTADAVFVWGYQDGGTLCHSAPIGAKCHTNTIRIPDERPGRGKRPRQRSKGSSPVRRPQRGRRAGEWERPIIPRLRPLWGSYKYMKCPVASPGCRPLRGLNPGLLPCDTYGIFCP